MDPELNIVLSLFKPFTFGMAVEIMAMLILLFCSALFSGAEIEGKIPEKNDKISYKNFIFTIEAADK